MGSPRSPRLESGTLSTLVTDQAYRGPHGTRPGASRLRFRPGGSGRRPEHQSPRALGGRPVPVEDDHLSARSVVFKDEGKDVTFH